MLIIITGESNGKLWLVSDNTRQEIHDKLCCYSMTCVQYSFKFSILAGYFPTEIREGKVVFKLGSHSLFFFDAEGRIVPYNFAISYITIH